MKYNNEATARESQDDRSAGRCHHYPHSQRLGTKPQQIQQPQHKSWKLEHKRRKIVTQLEAWSTKYLQKIY